MKKTMWFPLACTVAAIATMVAVGIWMAQHNGSVWGVVLSLPAPLCVAVYIVFGKKLGKWENVALLAATVTPLIMARQSVLETLMIALRPEGYTPLAVLWLVLTELVNLAGVVLALIGVLGNLRRVVLLQGGAWLQAAAAVAAVIDETLIPSERLFIGPETVWADLYWCPAVVYGALAVFYIGLAVLAIAKKREQVEVMQEQGESV